MDNSTKPYDLGERTKLFARDIIALVNSLSKTLPNVEIMKQLVRSAGSVGANYIEANESLSKKDFGLRIKICKKEAKESYYWLELLDVRGAYAEDKRTKLMEECSELEKYSVPSFGTMASHLSRSIRLEFGFWNLEF